MNLNRSGLLAALLFLSFTVHSQKKLPAVLLRTGTVIPSENIRESAVDSFNKNAIRYNTKTFVLLQFESIPGQEVRKMLSGSGIELLDYMPVNTYSASITGELNISALRAAHAKAFFSLTPLQKMESHLANGVIPSWAVKVPGT